MLPKKRSSMREHRANTDVSGSGKAWTAAQVLVEVSQRAVQSRTCRSCSAAQS
jgi:hypothetical protein